MGVGVTPPGGRLPPRTARVHGGTPHDHGAVPADHGDSSDQVRISRFLLRRAFRNPTSLMVTAWASYVVVLLVGPMQPLHPVHWSTWALVGGFIFVFWIGSLLNPRPQPRSTLPGESPSNGADGAISGHRMTLLIRNFAVVGLIGGLFVFVDKVVFSGLDFSAGFTKARFNGADLGTLFSSSYYRSPLLYPGLISYSFSLISFTLYILNSGVLPRWCLAVSAGSLISPLLVSLAYGGRSTLFLALVLPIGAVIVRFMKGKRTISRLGWAIPAFLLIVVLVGFYDSRIQADRRRYEGINNYQTELRYDETYRGFRIRPWAKGIINSGVIPSGAALQIVSLDVYTLQGPTNLDHAVRYSGSIGPFFGQYEIVSLGPVLGRTVPKLSVVDRMYRELGQANLLGGFVTAWGALAFDFGWVGALLVTMAWGWLGTKIWYKAISTDHVGAQMACCFVFLSVISSPIHSVVGAGAGTFLFLDVLIAYRILRPKRPSSSSAAHSATSPSSPLGRPLRAG